MNISKNKTLVSVITAILIISIAVPMLTSAQTVSTYTSYIYIQVGDNLLGVGQSLLIIVWTADVPPRAAGETQGDRGWANMEVRITAPDNTTTTIQKTRSDSIGSIYVDYVPEQTGTYSAVAYIPGQWKNTTTVSNFYSEGFSKPVTFEVQADPVPTRPDAPVPADYWTRPLSQINHLYYVLESNWLGGAGDQVPAGSAGEGNSLTSYGPGPGSAHILWTKPFWVGGMMDDRYDSNGFMQYQYQGLTWSAIVIDGKVFYSPRYTHATNQGLEIVDLYTGETLYKNYTAIMPSFGQVYNYESPNQHGGFPYLYNTVTASNLPEVIRVTNVQQLANLTLVTGPLVGGNAASNLNRTTTTNNFGTMWEIIDAHTMNHVTYIANVSNSGTQVYGKDGSILRYNLVNFGNNTNPAYRMTIWNASAGTMVAYNDGTDAWQWRPAGAGGGGSTTPWWGSSVSYSIVHNGNVFYTGNFSTPNPFNERNALLNETATIRAIREGEYAILATAGRNDERGVVPAYVMAIDLSLGHEGQQLWAKTFTPPFASQAGNVTITLTGAFSIDKDTVTMCYASTKLDQRWGYDAKTGELLWTVDMPQADYYGFNTNRLGNLLLTSGYGGVLNAIDLRTGLVWNYSADNDYLGDSVFGRYPMNIGALSTDGKIFIGTGQHSPGPILESGNVLQCINSSDGALLWNYPVYGVSMPSGNAGNYFVLADGRLMALNAYDGQIYCFGRGKSGTTVDASPAVIIDGASTMIEGTVTDQTDSGRLTTNDNLDFSLKGTPAISDADQTNWMIHLFQQGAKPTDASGVLVTLTAVDPNGNPVPVGETTSDVNGNYAIPFTPEVPGTYQIIATFAGSESYGPSSATTYMNVGEAAAPTEGPTATPTSVADLYFVPAVVGIIVAILLVGVAIILVLRKRP